MEPGIKAGTTITQPVMNIDVAPTLLDLAGLSIPPIMDGMSMVPLLMPSSQLSQKTARSPWRSLNLTSGKIKSQHLLWK